MRNIKMIIPMVLFTLSLPNTLYGKTKPFEELPKEEYINRVEGDTPPPSSINVDGSVEVTDQNQGQSDIQPETIDVNNNADTASGVVSNEVPLADIQDGLVQEIPIQQENIDEVSTEPETESTTMEEFQAVGIGQVEVTPQPNNNPNTQKDFNKHLQGDGTNPGFWGEEESITNANSIFEKQQELIEKEEKKKEKEKMDWGTISTSGLSDVAVADSSRINFNNVILDAKPLVLTLSDKKVEFVPAKIKPLTTLEDTGITPFEYKKFDITGILFGIVGSIALLIGGHIGFVLFVKQLKQYRKKKIEENVATTAGTFNAFGLDKAYSKSTYPEQNQNLNQNGKVLGVDLNIDVDNKENPFE